MKEWEALVTEEAQTFGLDPIVLKYEVQRELTLRAARRIADKADPATIMRIEHVIVDSGPEGGPAETTLPK